jgi:hypothetical protein
LEIVQGPDQKYGSAEGSLFPGGVRRRSYLGHAHPAGQNLDCWSRVQSAHPSVRLE